jgi:hypothetical protein
VCKPVKASERRMGRDGGGRVVKRSRINDKHKDEDE